MYSSGKMFSALMRGLFWCLFPELRSDDDARLLEWVVFSVCYCIEVQAG